MMHIDKQERQYIIISLVLIGIFATALLVSSTAGSISLVSPESQIDPTTLSVPGANPAYDGFSNPVENRVLEVAPGVYEAYVIGYATKGWKWEPEELTFPAGSEVTFYVTSGDVIHGFRVPETNLNMMVIPGQVSRITTTFETPGEYDYICHEYCGILHHNMAGKIIIE